MIRILQNIISEKEFQEDITDFLMEICSVDTTPGSDIGLMGAKEAEVFGIIRERLLKFSFDDVSIIEKKISPAIKDHPAFSKLHFTKTDLNPDGLSPEDVYKDRYNLLYYLNGLPSDQGNSTALNAHIDVVAPFFCPGRRGDTVYGRGTIDDKGGVTAIYGALKVLDKLTLEKKIRLKNKITAMFVVEEETGGNGSLDLALDRVLKKRYDSVLVLECAGNKVYPANRGAVWFSCQASLGDSGVTAERKVTSPLESMIFAIIEMQKEGDRIKDESDHPLFPHKPVQTCNGILGPFGKHPSRICSFVACKISGVENSRIYDDIQVLLQKGVNAYIEKYGDKTLYLDMDTGKPRVEKHFEVENHPENKSVLLRIYGSSGHMGSILQHDAAITKWAYLAREIFIYKKNKGFPLEMTLDNFDSTQRIILEGGQGFLPTHSMDIIQERMRSAFIRGVKHYLQLIGAGENSLHCKVSYDKLHNCAFSCNPDSSTMKNAREAAVQAGIITPDEPIRGWDVSCDARLFAGEYPEMPVITSGPGELPYAHADNEQLLLTDLFNSIMFTALFLLKETGTIG